MALESLRRYRREILDAAQRHSARNVRVFGSMGAVMIIKRATSTSSSISSQAECCSMYRSGAGPSTTSRKKGGGADGGLSPYLQHRVLAEAASL
jgi:hypothetical protein